MGQAIMSFTSLYDGGSRKSFHKQQNLKSESKENEMTTVTKFLQRQNPNFLVDAIRTLVAPDQRPVSGASTAEYFNVYHTLKNTNTELLHAVRKHSEQDFNNFTNGKQVSPSPFPRLQVLAENVGAAGLLDNTFQVLYNEVPGDSELNEECFKLIQHIIESSNNSDAYSECIGILQRAYDAVLSQSVTPETYDQIDAELIGLIPADAFTSNQEMSELDDVIEGDSEELVEEEDGDLDEDLNDFEDGGFDVEEGLAETVLDEVACESLDSEVIDVDTDVMFDPKAAFMAESMQALLPNSVTLELNHHLMIVLDTECPELSTTALKEEGLSINTTATMLSGNDLYTDEPVNFWHTLRRTAKDSDAAGYIATVIPNIVSYLNKLAATPVAVVSDKSLGDTANLIADKLQEVVSANIAYQLDGVNLEDCAIPLIPKDELFGMLNDDGLTVEDITEDLLTDLGVPFFNLTDLLTVSTYVAGSEDNPIIVTRLDITSPRVSSVKSANIEKALTSSMNSLRKLLEGSNVDTTIGLGFNSVKTFADVNVTSAAHSFVNEGYQMFSLADVMHHNAFGEQLLPDEINPIDAEQASLTFSLSSDWLLLADATNPEQEDELKEI